MQKNPLENLLDLWKKKDVWTLCKIFFDVELTKRQEEIVKVVTFGEHKRAVITCMTRYGKSWAVSLGILLWIMQNKNKKIVIIAPTNEKTTIIRNYIAFFVSKSPVFLALLDLNKKKYERIRSEVSRRRMTWKNGVEMRTLSAEGQGEQLMGFGADLLIVDESCDVDFEVYRSKISRMLGESPNAVYIEIGNPWHKDNHMWQHWIDINWHKIHIGFEEAIKEGRVSKEFIEEQKIQLTEREFQILYKAEFPEESEDQLIKYDWIDRATKTIPSADSSFIKRLGIDVARSGNDSTVFTYGLKFKEGVYIVDKVVEHNQEDTMQTTARAFKLYEENLFDEICIDTNGLGAGVTDRLNELRRENKIKSRIIAFMSGQSPSTDRLKERFLNQKAEAYFHLRELFEKGKIFIPKNNKLINQLSKMKWELTSSGKIRILDPGQGKDDTAEAKSPDHSDSLCYFCWDGGEPPLCFGILSWR